MLQPVAQGISGPDATSINWSHSRDDIVEGVDALFSAIKKQEQEEQDLMEAVWKFVETVASIAGAEYRIPIEIGAAAAFLPLFVIGSAYMDAANDIKRKEVTSGFTNGLAMGVMMETKENFRDYFWQDQPGTNSVFPESEKMAQYYYNGALALGYAQGKEVVAKGVSAVFFADVKQQIDDPLGDPDQENWGPRDWINYYIELGAAFHKGHITD
jgi:hypothetical protein